ncbi:hypothetical protein PYW07_013259 [Mythimna separata]|uniref:V-type proton ATPase subunit S1 n=1 Tax=Mythimna separata TaxID=271217 RepID=A0AAD7Y606_MYTSE|nr:hypothetical protein PYW07_013259 [Mythimna separata]
MAFCRVVYSLLVLSVISCYASKVPVYLWGDSLKSSIKSNPLTTYTCDEFGAVLKQVLVEEPVTVVVFTEETLSVEDFSLKNEDGETSFPYLHENLGEAIYMPTVKDALATLNRTAGPDAVNIFSEDPVPVGARFVFINLNDAREDESRADMLRRHDAYMQETIAKMQEMQEDLNIVAVYTANYPSWTIPVTKSRVRREAEGATEGARTSRMYTLDGLRLVASSIQVKAGNDSRTLSEAISQDSSLNDTYVNATLTFENSTSLLLNFNSHGGYWFFDEVVLTMGSVVETLYPPEDEVFAVLGFSYRCAQYITFTSINETTTYTVSFVDMKVQPFFETNTTQIFGESFNCVPFFSASIWAGLFVVFILLSITFYGIMMMLDIRTMDRFDDPKGKTITINAAE